MCSKGRSMPCVNLLLCTAYHKYYSYFKIFIFPFVAKLLLGFVRNYVPSKGVMYIDARFGNKILPIGVEILDAKQSLDLAINKAQHIPLHNNFNKSRK